VAAWLCAVVPESWADEAARGAAEREAAGEPQAEGEPAPAAPSQAEAKGDLAPGEQSIADGLGGVERIVVEARRPISAASSREVRGRDFMVRPHITMNQVLNNIPGLVVAQHQGGSKAAQYFLRGFDADHGTDVAVWVDNLPVNFVTHAHGQGYADLNFVIPETLETVELYKGPYFPQFGDFATAGALKLVTKEEFDENFATAEGGSFDTQRYVIGASPKLGLGMKTLLVGSAYYTNGPFINPEHLARYNGMGRLTLDPTSESKLSVTLQGYAADWDASGQIPEPQVARGVLNRFGSVDPTEGGRSDRQNLMMDWRWRPTAADTVDVDFYATRYKLRLWSNFTFYGFSGLRFIRNPDGSIDDTGNDQTILPTGGSKWIPGDGIYQGDSRYMFGGKARYTREYFLFDIPMQSQFAFETRNDDIHVTLQRQVRRESFYTVNDVYVQESSFSGYWAQNVFFTDWLRFEGGLRGDYYTFDVADRLPSQGRDPNFSSVYLNGDNGEGIISPKANLIITPVENTDVYLNFGQGFHSNDARAAIGGPRFSGSPNANPTGVPFEDVVKPLAKATGYELGARTRQFDKLDVAAALWRLHLDSELVFSGDAGTDEPSIGSSRYGVDFEVRYQIFDWLFADYDLSWVHARLDDDSYVPLAPPILMNGGLTADFKNGFTMALRGRYIADRPATEDDSLTAQGYYLLDAFAKYRWRNVELGIQLLNLTDTEWREAQFADTSCVHGQIQRNDPARPCYWKPGRNAAEPKPAIHFTPGNPIAVQAGLTVFF